MSDTWAIDLWLESFLAKPSWRLHYETIWDSNPEILDDMLSESIRREKGICFADIKIPTINTKIIQKFETWGFRIVDTNIAFEKERNLSKQPQTAYSELSLAMPGDKDEVMKIAGDTFVFTRFHLDPEIENSVANKIKAEWAGNYFSGKRGDKMLLAKVDGHVAGFLQLLKGANSTWIIDLIGVSKEHQRKNVASDLILLAEEKLEDCMRMLVGTQVANIPSMRLYEKLGYRVADTKYVLHYHGKS